LSAASYKIEGGDFDRAGLATASLKELLLKVGVDRSILRRVLIVAYEAEMNVVIHAYRGTMQAFLKEGEIELEFSDEGPGIADIDLAMKEGYSTASHAARELGFGAGMGLPNIRKNSDRFAIESAVGRGTALRAAVRLKPQEAGEGAPNSIHVEAPLCQGCLRCLSACPTGALRVHEGKPRIFEPLCIDCAACIASCPTGALTVEGAASDMPQPAQDMILILPYPVLAQFGPTSPQQVIEALASKGFTGVVVTDAWEAALSQAVADFAEKRAKTLPVISPVCPVVANLIRLGFPSLIENLALFLSPIEAILTELGDRKAALVTLCPAQRTQLLSARASKNCLFVKPSRVHQEIAHAAVSNDAGFSTTAAESGPPSNGILRASGLRHVIDVLKQAENGLLGDVKVLELFACEQGCFGSALLSLDAFIARHRWMKAPLKADKSAKALDRKSPWTRREGLRLDKDMAAAIRKLSQVSALRRGLPGKDCGMCGAPTCTALAEDVVLGRTGKSACPFLAAAKEVRE